jgi:(p)ppGpp synthase/HD superfamily hydrolase
MSEQATEDKKPLFDAIEFAAEAHRMQLRKGTNLPYIVHPLRVATILLENDCCDATVIAGILHDTVEDTSVKLPKISDRFGEDVVRIVKGVSEDKSLSWEERKAHTIESMKTAPMDVLLVTCADKLDNIQSIRDDLALNGEQVWKKFNRPKQQQEKYYRGLAEVLVRRADGEPSSRLFHRLRREVDELFGSR